MSELRLVLRIHGQVFRVVAEESKQSLLDCLSSS